MEFGTQFEYGPPTEVSIGVRKSSAEIEYVD
jgi:hypothetical protein